MCLPQALILLVRDFVLVPDGVVARREHIVDVAPSFASVSCFCLLVLATTVPVNAWQRETRPQQLV